MIKLDINFVISDELRKTGGLVIILPNKLEEEEFLERHSAFFEDGNRITESGSEKLYRFSVNVKDTVTFAHLDTPGKSYVYRFVPENSDQGKPIEEKQIGIGSGGAIYIDKATNDPVESVGSMDHYISGGTISQGDAIGLSSMTLDMWVDRSACRVKGPVRICHARDSDVRRLTSKFHETGERD